MILKLYFTLQLILLSLLTVTECLNILAIMPHQGKSHQLVFEPVFKKLASNGHNLTLITRFPQKNPVPNWRDISVAQEILNTTEILSFDMLTGTRLDRYLCIVFLAFGASISCEEGLSHPNYQRFLQEDNHFDIILIELFNTPCFMGVAKRFNAPVIGLASSIWMPWAYQDFGSIGNPSYVPNHFMGHNDHMGFLARVENTLMHVFNVVFYKIFMHDPGNRWSKKYTGVDLDDGRIMSNISLMLINCHYSLNSKMPLSPNSIEIGGIHVESVPVKPLTQDLEKFVRESKHGVIYMSLGSTIRTDSLPEAKKQAFLKAFSRLPQRVVWKWEGEMVNKPDNVMTVRWAPQRDILCHPNVKVFISHSGLLGLLETVDCGTPVLMLPLFGDQFTNAECVETNGGGLTLEYSTISEEIIYDKLQKLLSPKFIISAKELSKRFKDRPLSAMDTALYWIEYVARHKGAHFMKLASVDMPLYQYYLLDVIAFISLFIIIYLYMLYLFVKFVFRKLCKRQEKIKKS